MCKHFLSKLFGPRTSSSRRRLTRRSRDCRPALERLEDRLTPSVGKLDPTFGQGGQALTPFGGGSDIAVAQAVAIQPNDGKIVAAGFDAGPGGSDFALARYNVDVSGQPDGSLDTNFDYDGKVTTDFSGSDDVATAVAIQNDGKIVVVGDSIGGPNTSQVIALARYKTDGSLDTNFGFNGTGLTTLSVGAGAAATGVVVQQDGTILVGGWQHFGVSDGSSVDGFLLVRFTSTGIFDTTFGVGGFASPAPDFARAYALAVQPGDSKIVLAGTDNLGVFIVARYLPDGEPDLGFGDHGIAGMPIPQKMVVQSLAIQSDGRIVVGGEDAGGTVLVRLQPNGQQLDHDFSADGVLSTNVGSAAGLAIQPNGYIVAAGGEYVQRFLPKGTPDPSFGSGGVAEDFFSHLTSVALQNDGKIVAAGFVEEPQAAEFDMIRLTGNDFQISQLGGFLSIGGTNAGDMVGLTLNVQGRVTVADADGPIGTFRGVTQVAVNTLGGDDVVTVYCPDDNTTLPDLLVDLGRGNDRFTLSANGGDVFARRPERAWSIDVSGGEGDDQVRTNIQGSVPVQLAVDLGAGNDFADLAFNGVAHVPLPESVAVQGGQGDDTIRVGYTFIPQAAPDPGNAPISVNVDGGQGNDHIRVSYGVLPPPVHDLPAVFSIPLTTNVTGGAGDDDIRVIFGVSDPNQLGALPPAIGPGGSVQVLLDGGDGDDTIRADLWLDPRSTGPVAAQVLGGRGNDDLTLNIYGVLDPDWLSALIDGGLGSDTAHYTTNVRVINCER
jgi:uncharacterized delta-60 repeat protein